MPNIKSPVNMVLHDSDSFEPVDTFETKPVTWASHGHHGPKKHNRSHNFIIVSVKSAASCRVLADMETKSVPYDVA